MLINSDFFFLFEENSQIFLKISVIPILLAFMYLVALNLLVFIQLSSSLRQIIVPVPLLVKIQFGTVQNWINKNENRIPFSFHFQILLTKTYCFIENELCTETWGISDPLILTLSWPIVVKNLLIFFCFYFLSLFFSWSIGGSKREEKTISLLLLWQKVSKNQTSARTPSEPCSWDGTISMQVSVTSVGELEGAEL